MNEFLTTQKKLQTPWSAQYVGRGLTATLLKDLCTNFDSLERKAKMRVLVSLLALDSKKKVEVETSLKKLLYKADESSADKSSDSWVSITAGIVYERLYFSGKTCADFYGSLSDSSQSSLEDTMEWALKYLFEREQSDVSTTTEISPYALPLKHNFLPLPNRCNLISGNNTHFLYHGERLDIMGREQKRQKVDDNLFLHRSTLMNVASAHDGEMKRNKMYENQDAQRRAIVPDKAASSAPTTGFHDIKKSLVASVASQGQKLQSASAQSISMEAVKASRLNPEYLTAAEKRELAKRTKLAAKKERDMAKKRDKEYRGAARTQEDGSKPTSSKGLGVDNKSTEEAGRSLLSENNLSGDSQQQQPPLSMEQQQHQSNLKTNLQVLQQVEASTLLNVQDKALIVAFFGRSSSSGAPLPLVPAAGTARFLLKESPILDETAVHKIGKEMTYLDLDYAAKTFKFITKKAFRKPK